MLRADVLKSSAFRLALIFSALFLATFLVAGVLAYRIIVADLHERLDSSIAATYDLIARSYTDGDLEDLIGTVATYAASSNEHDKIFFLADASGTVLAGNVQSVAAPVGLSTLQGNSLGVDETDLYRTRSGTVAGNQLVVATSFAETDEFGSLTVASFGWAGAIAAVIAVMSGLLIAGVVRKRIDAIGRTMSLVGQGELAARIPLRGSGDDLDHLSFQINGALDRLSALVEGMRQVSVDIAHDLKTPLNRLSILVEGAVEKAERASSNAEELYQVQAEIVRINATFEALLRIAQLESGSRRERFTQVLISEVLGVLYEAYEDVAAESNLTLNLSVDAAAELTVNGDRDLLTQLFANLIENAIRHAKGGTQIDLSIVSLDGKVAVKIVDDGPGIPDGERAKVFQRLYRLEKSRSTEGTGLGLSMVKAIADLHAATVVLSDAAPGLAVTVTFPAKT